MIAPWHPLLFLAMGANYLNWRPVPNPDRPGEVFAGIYSPNTTFNTASTQLPNINATITGGINPTPTTPTGSNGGGGGVTGSNGGTGGNGGGGSNPCNCGGLGRNASWHSEDDTSFDGRRCRSPRFGWTWSEQSGDYTEPPVMTIPPGSPQKVSVTGSNIHFLTSSTNELGQPCGVITQDILQGIPEGDGHYFRIGPSSIPSSLYCAHPTTPYWQSPAIPTSSPTSPPTSSPSPTGGGNGGGGNGVGVSGGSIWRRGWLDLELSSTLEIDAVCQCSLGPIAAVFELSGVVFSTPLIDEAINYDTMGIFTTTSTLQTRASDTETLTQKSGYWNGVDTGETGNGGGWTPTTSYDAPLHFYCREDYTLYWLLRIAFTAVFDTSSNLYDVYNTKIRPFAHGDPTDPDFWRVYYVAGVDCQRNLIVPSSDEAVLSACHTPGGGGVDEDAPNPFILNTSYFIGLDVGQLFYQFNLSNLTGIEESSLTLEDVDDHLWALASLRRRNPAAMAEGTITTGEDDYTPIPLNADETLDIDGMTNPGGGNTFRVYRANNDTTTWPNFYEYAIETTSLFVRLLMVYPTSPHPAPSRWRTCRNWVRLIPGPNSNTFRVHSH